MTIALAGGILARIPEEFVLRAAEGSVERVGMILRDSATKKIVGHLQETGLAQKAVTEVISRTPGAVQSLATPLSQVSTAISVVQNQQIKTRLDGMAKLLGGMQALQTATLVSSVAGIGVTVASTAILVSRMKGLEKGISDLDGKLEELRRDTKVEAIQKEIVGIRTMLERLQEVPSSRTPEAETRAAEKDLHSHFSRLADQAARLNGVAALPAEFLSFTFTALALGGAAQTRSLVWLGELDRARQRSESIAAKLDDVALAMPADRIAALTGDAAAAIRLDAAFAEVRLRAASMPSYTATLHATGVDGRAYLEGLEAEQEETFLLLKPVTG